MDDLITFLRARLDEREQKALAAAKWYGKDWEDHGNHVVMDDAGANVILDRASEHDEMDAAVAAFVVDNDPAFVLADVAAKRQIIDVYCQERTLRDLYQAPDARAAEDEDQVTRRRSAAARCRGLEIAVEALALPYVDHPDYRAEWTP